MRQSYGPGGGFSAGAPGRDLFSVAALRELPPPDPNEAMPSSDAIGALEDRLRSDPSALDRFMEESSFPLADPPLYTFVYRGGADAVRLRHWIYGLPTSQDFVRMTGTDLWYRTVELPPGSRVEYKFEVVSGGHGSWVLDALNDATARDPFGANSVVTAEGYEEPEWAHHDPDAREGWLEERSYVSQALGGSRQVTLYFPARYRPTRRYPLLVVHDGPDYLEYSGLKIVLDNLIHRLEIPGLVVALTHPGDRMREYACSDEHTRFICDELVPQLEEELPLVGAPEGRGLMGASLGAVASLHTAAQRPDTFGRLIVQSGSFAFTDIGDNMRGPAFEPIVAFMNDYRAEPYPVARQIFQSVGRYESLVYENRSLVPVLRSSGMKVRYREVPDGHNWENWRDRLREGLSWLFPGPLWMVYE